MEQTLQQQGEKVLQSLLEIVQNGLDKAPDYVLDFFNRFQLWRIVDSLVGIIMFGLIASLLGYRIYKTLKRKDIDWEREPGLTCLMVFGGIVVICLFVAVVWYIGQIIQVSILPELSLIEFLKTYH